MDFDSNDQEVEYERLNEALTGEGSDDLVHRIHTGHAQLWGEGKILHLYAVAELASQHANTYYTEHDFHTQQYGKAVCKLGGLLHEAMEWGAVFEDVVDVSDEITAQVVAALTPDRRLTRPKRQRLLINQIGLATPNTQLVKLADLQHDCFGMLKLLENKIDEERVLHVRDWVDDAREIMPVLTHITESLYLAPQLVDLKDKVTQLRYNCEELCRKKRRKR